MQKLIMVALLFSLSFSGIALAETNWHTANQTTVGWDQDFGNIDPAQIKWNVYVANAITDPGKTNPEKVGVATETQYTVTLNTEGRYFVGVSSFRVVDTKEIESDVLWSDAGATPFGIQFFEVPSMPSGLILK